MGINTAALHPGVLLPWVLIPLVKGCKGGSTLRAAALSALAVLLMGGVNAADTLDVLIMPVIFLLTRQPSPRRRSLAGWWVICTGLATMWWLIPLLFLGKYGFNFSLIRSSLPSRPPRCQPRRSCRGSETGFHI